MIRINTRGISTDEARQPNLISGLLIRYDKSLPGGGTPGHQGRLSEVYKGAIELNGGSLVSAGGVVTTFGLLGGGVGFFSLNFPVAETFWEYFFIGFGWLIVWSLFLIGIYFEMFSPSESPIYFDRAHRKVYYVHQGRKLFWLFGPSKVQARAVDWDLVDCEQHATLGSTGSSVSRNYHLVFLVRASATDPTIVDSFLMPGVQLGGPLWEYIRGYMEADRPPLHAEEAPPTKGPRGSEGFDMIEALKQRLRDYRRDWKELFWKQLLFHLLFPLFAVFLVVNRFVVWTAQKVRWPQDILDALGPPITEADLAADTQHRLRAKA